VKAVRTYAQVQTAIPTANQNKATPKNTAHTLTSNGAKRAPPDSILAT
jgi:hypothetical protein